jgi:hypothetical protein
MKQPLANYLSAHCDEFINLMGRMRDPPRYSIRRMTSFRFFVFIAAILPSLITRRNFGARLNIFY